jgi:copper(I)-binding protein
MNIYRTLLAATAVVAVLTLAAACDDDSDGEAEPAGEVQVTEVFARAALDSGGVYMIIENGSDEADALVAANAEIAGKTEIHQTITEGAETRMEPIDRIDVPAGGTVELAPGGLHIMLMELDTAIEPGDEFALKLTFEKAGEMIVTATGRDYGDMSDMGSEGEDGGMEMGQ